MNIVERYKTELEGLDFYIITQVYKFGHVHEEYIGNRIDGSAFIYVNDRKDDVVLISEIFKNIEKKIYILTDTSIRKQKLKKLLNGHR